jgi:hypothetical protein
MNNRPIKENYKISTDSKSPHGYVDNIIYD